MFHESVVILAVLCAVERHNSAYVRFRLLSVTEMTLYLIVSVEPITVTGGIRTNGRLGVQVLALEYTAIRGIWLIHAPF